MRALQPPDGLHLQAAQGWLGLGDHVEANEEFEEIAPKLRRQFVSVFRWLTLFNIRAPVAHLDRYCALTP
jgi:hypothetical protein